MRNFLRSSCWRRSRLRKMMGESVIVILWVVVVVGIILLLTQ